MTTYNEYYVRNTNGTDSAGGGTSHATAYQTIQFAIDDIVATHGKQSGTTADRINLCDESAFVLTSALDPTNYGNSAVQRWLVFQGYTSTPGDGGLFDIDLNGGAYSLVNGSHDYWTFAYGKLHNNSGSNYLWDFDGVGQRAFMMEFYDTAHSAVGGGASASGVEYCWFHDIERYGIETHQMVHHCLFTNGTTKKFLKAMYRPTHATHNFISVDGSTDGIEVVQYNHVANNTVLSNGGTGKGINCQLYFHSLYNNIVEGFSGTGGVGINNLSNNTYVQWWRNNAVFNCDTEYGNQDNHIILPLSEADNEILVSSPFKKTGSLPTDFTSSTFWSDVYKYFEPVGVGNVYDGFPTGTYQTKGAVGRQQLGGGSTNIKFLSKFTPNPASDLSAGGTMADDLAHINEMNWPGWTTYAGAPTLEGARLKMLSADRTTYGNGSYQLNFAGFDYGETDVQIFAHALSSSGQPAIVVRHDPVAKTFYMVYRSSTTLHLFYFNGSTFDSSLTSTSISSVSNAAFDLIGARVVGSTLEAFYNDSTTPLLSHTMTNNATATCIGVLGNAANTYFNHYAVMEPFVSYSDVVPYSLSVPNTAETYSLHPLAYN